HLEACVLDTRLLRLGASLLDESRRDVHPERRAGRPDERGELLGRVAEAAADIEHAVTRLWRIDPHRLVPEPREAAADEVAVVDEAIEEDAVPCLLRLEVLTRDVGHTRSLCGARLGPTDGRGDPGGTKRAQSGNCPPRTRPAQGAVDSGESVEKSASNV